MIDRGECVEWSGAKSASGYGVKRFEGRNQYVHRLAFACVNGPIPAGILVMHACDNPACYRVEHLSLGTDADNHADKSRKDRVPRKLTRINVAAIRTRLAAGEAQASIAADFGVSRSAIKYIKLGTSWHHASLTPEPKP